ncbi:MAG TPA: hypothetical protein PL156_04845 [Rhodoglobus sp.]|nr:hypothetical protein [Rhodoglobus sp.]HQJ34480.1 hypothetical protein [Rhodoglobus sp.]
MPAHWFRITYARNALLRSLAEAGLDLGALTPSSGLKAMLDFARDFRPQHAELDELFCRWGPTEQRYEFAIVRRMRRHDHPEAQLSLVFEFAPTPSRVGSGTAAVTTERDATSTDGYRAIVRAAVVGRRID